MSFLAAKRCYRGAMTRLADGIEVEPVQAEVFVVWLNGDHLELTGRAAPRPG